MSKLETIRLLDAARFTERQPEPHQAAAWNLLQGWLTPEQLDEFAGVFRAGPAPKPAPLVTMEQATAVFQRVPTLEQLADLNACLRRFAITTPARIRHFLAQVSHESGGLRWMVELASGDAYEGRKDLDNTEPGDGRRFKGAGALQLTGRYNYQQFADFIGDPRVMEGANYVAATYPFTSAGFWWQRNGMNMHADAGASVAMISSRVNGRDPANGLADRLAAYDRALRQFPDPNAPTPAAGTPRPHLTLTRMGKRDNRGLEQLKLAYVRGGTELGSIVVVTGAPGAQVFQRGHDSRAGSLQPLPEGQWKIEDPAWAGGKDNWTASWGAGLGPVSVPLTYVGPGKTGRSAIEIHIDWNARVVPGTAGCIGVANRADMSRLLWWLKDTDPQNLYVDWGLGTCPKPA